MARLGKVRRGKAWLGMAGMARQARRVVARLD